MTPGGKWHKVVFGVSAAALLLSAYRAFAPAGGADPEAYHYRVVLPAPPEVPGFSSAVLDGDLKEYWEEGRMVWVQPVIDKVVQAELPLPRPTLAVPPMPLPDPSPLLEHSGGLPRWGQVPRAGLEEEE